MSRALSIVGWVLVRAFVAAYMAACLWIAGGPFGCTTVPVAPTPEPPELPDAGAVDPCAVPYRLTPAERRALCIHRLEAP